jgi:hypothetical protein
MGEKCRDKREFRNAYRILAWKSVSKKKKGNLYLELGGMS